jgi:hypothetical protein
MKKQLLFLIVLVTLSVGMAYGQVLYSDDFESYTVGNGIAEEETGDIWNTWNGAPGTAEDPLVSDAYAHGGTQSIVVEGTNDGVIEFNDIVTNRYRVEFYLYIPSGKLGYYNIMQNFVPTSATANVWGMQIFFQNGVGTIDGNGEAEQTFSYESDTWIKMQHFIDLDNDWVDMYIDDVLVHAYQWSHGTFNDGTGVNKLDAFNFYAWNEGGTCQYYMDDFLIEQVEIPNPPINFTAVAEGENNVIVSWDAPAEGTPESYSVIRDGEEIAVVEGAFSYTDQGLYPGEYTYQVKAYYGEGVGYSASAGNESVTIEGGTGRNFVVFEHFTSVGCGFCPIVAQTIDMIVNEGKDVAIIEYHNLNNGPDEYAISAADTRNSFYYNLYPNTTYSLIPNPGSVFNGTEVQYGTAEQIADEKAVYDYYYDEQIVIPSVYTINASEEPISTDPFMFDITIDIEETLAYFDADIRMMVVLTETDIVHSWQSLSELHYVAREVYPNTSGTILDFSSETTYNTTINVTIDPTWDVDNCEVVIFVQNFDTGHILQAQKVGLYSFTSNEIENTLETTIYPNPAKDNVRIASGSVIKNVQVYSVTGEKIMFVQPNSNLAEISIDALASGVYILRIETADDSEMKRIIVE